VRKIVQDDISWAAGDEETRYPSSNGIVYLIGAGPGDPDLITVKGLRCLRRADVVLYDRLINDELLAEARQEALRIFVGKSPSHHTLQQAQINELLIHYARQGLTVARLKGGDPFIFGRGGEEAEALAQAGIPFEVVPGVSSAIAVPAYAGIPLTHRDYTSSVTFVTGQEGQTSASPGIRWDALATLGGTLVILMGVKALPSFTQQLMDAGLSPNTPAAAIQNGTMPQQRIVTGTLATIATRVTQARLASPAIIVIGSVVNLHDTIAWYQTCMASH
jgi:uroporphyrin-III C-methyltransferase